MSGKRRLLNNELPELEKLMAMVGLENKFSGNATLIGSDPIIYSPHKLSEAMSYCLLLSGICTAAIWEKRTGKTVNLYVSNFNALNYLHSSHYVSQNNKLMKIGVENVPVNGVFKTKDNRLLMTIAGPPYMKLLNGYLDVFKCPNTKEAYAKEVAKYNVDELENLLAEKGLPACRIFETKEWLEHPQGKAIKDLPFIGIEKISDGETVPFNTDPKRPLENVNVLDFTHVLAGPKSGRVLAENGANVLHVSSPKHEDTKPQHLSTDIGKKCTYLDLNLKDDRDKMDKLLQDTDVFVSSYRPSVHIKLNLTAEDVVCKNPKGMVYVTINAYGHTGPWKDRPGFDPNGQVATGFCADEGGKGNLPKISPVMYLGDLITAYFASAGMQVALLRRAEEGGSYHVKVSLSQSTMWVQSLGTIDFDKLDGLPEKDTYKPIMETFKTMYGEIEQLSPCVKFENMPGYHARHIEPYGASDATWFDAKELK